MDCVFIYFVYAISGFTDTDSHNTTEGYPPRARRGGGRQGAWPNSLDSYYPKRCINMAKNAQKFTYGIFLRVY